MKHWWKENKIYKLYLELLEEYGEPVVYWPQWCAKEKSIIEKIANLLDSNILTELIRPAGFFQTKPKRLYDVCKYVKRKGLINILQNGKVEEIRSELMNITICFG